MRTTAATLVLVGVLAAGCAPSPTPIFVQKFVEWKYDEGKFLCTFETDTTLIDMGGPLDVGYGLPEYRTTVTLTGGADIIPSELKVGTVVLEKAAREKVIVNRIDYAYRSEPAIVGLEPRTVYVYGVLSGELRMGLELLGQDVSLAVSTIDATQVYDLFVDMRFSGYLSGSGAPVSTGLATYPIRLFKTSVGACARNNWARPNPCNWVGQTDLSFCCNDLLEGETYPGCPKKE